jgi:ribose/xylose/arabinose/galactoside ABC-type transport system permease subunit
VAIDVPDTNAPTPGDADGGVPPPEPPRRSRPLVFELIGRYATLIGFLAVIVGFSLARPEIFPTWTNARTILDQAAVVIILATGLTVVITTQEFDLSFPGVVTLASVLSVNAMAEWHWGTVPAVLVGLAVGGGCGLISGALVAARRASSFITTLALGAVWGGVAIGISKDQSSITGITEGYGNLTFWRPLGIPVNVFYALAVVLLCYGILRWTVFGRNASAVGANEVAARLAGLPLPKVRIGAFAVMGLCSGLVAVILSSRGGGFQPGVAGGLLVPPFVAVFFGLSVLASGRFNVPGTVIGALFIGTLQTGLNIIGKSGWVADVVVGTTLVIILFAASSVRSQR